MQRTPACPLITEEQLLLFHCRCLDDGGSLGTATKGSLSCCIPISSQRDGATTPRAGAAVTARVAAVTSIASAAITVRDERTH